MEQQEVLNVFPFKPYSLDSCVQMKWQRIFRGIAVTCHSSAVSSSSFEVSIQLLFHGKTVETSHSPTPSRWRFSRVRQRVGVSTVISLGRSVSGSRCWESLHSPHPLSKEITASLLAKSASRAAGAEASANASIDTCSLQLELDSASRVRAATSCEKDAGKPGRKMH